ncbi:MAG: carboxypeptidase regulatory-like domain-containing protein [Acidobacteria bacterium]|nr:carboxypeptidase regulatory-like domain-containing protein [Acidobacteriota bacterium]
MKPLQVRFGMLFGALLGLAFLTLCSLQALAQTGAGSVTGTVRDPDQKVIPGASVTITNAETNVSHTKQSSEVGVYYFGALQRGSYTLTVEKDGFKKWSGKLVLEVGQYAVVDPNLEVGSVTTVLEVTGVAPAITTGSIEVSDIKDVIRIRQLPLNGRVISLLFNLTPGVEGGGNPRVNGLKVGSTEMTLDGISLVDRFGGGIARVQPGLETIQEFRIETTGSDARYSRPASITLSTRSGTNAFHGSAYEYHRNNSGGLLVRRREDDPESKPDQLIRNEYGVTAGGPFYLGNLYDGRNKTFWFAAFEGSRERGRQFSCDFGDNFCMVPTEAMWNGDFSNATDPDGTPWIIYDPLTTDADGLRQPFPGNKIPSDRISDFAKTLSQLTTRPTNDNNPWLGVGIVQQSAERVAGGCSPVVQKLRDACGLYGLGQPARNAEQLQRYRLADHLRVAPGPVLLGLLCLGL